MYTLKHLTSEYQLNNLSIPKYAWYYLTYIKPGRHNKHNSYLCRICDNHWNTDDHKSKFNEFNNLDFGLLIYTLYLNAFKYYNFTPLLRICIFMPLIYDVAQLLPTYPIITPHL